MSIFNKASDAYRRGYRDGEEDAPSQELSYGRGTFAAYDYSEGYKAGHDEKRWAEKRREAGRIVR